MNTPEERRAAEQLSAMAADPDRKSSVEHNRYAHARLIRHFDETGQEPVADAIRYGLRQVTSVETGGLSVPRFQLGGGYYVIDFPAPEDPSPDESDIADLMADERRADGK